MGTEKMTKRQAEILRFILDFTRDNGYAPSYREVGQALGISSVATVHEHIKNLEAKGCLHGEEGSARSLEVEPSLSRSAHAIALPLFGFIAAGEPIEAMETPETIDVPANMVNEAADTFVLRVKGNSMIDDGILPGDFVIVERNPAPRDGEIVVALLDNAYATLKRLFREKGRVRLQPANREMEPIYVTDVVVQGVVRGLIRDFRTLHAA